MFNLQNPRNSRDLEIAISKFRQLEKGESVYIEQEEFLDIIDYYLTEHQISKAIKVLNYAIKFYPKCYELKLAEAQLLIEAGIFSQATQKLKKLYLQNPDDLGLLMLIGINYAKSGIINKSMMFFDKALSKIENENKSPVLYTISQTFIQTGRFDIASYYLTKAYQYDSKDDSIIMDLAFCLERTKNYKKSQKLYTSYLRKNPFSKLAWYNLGVVYSSLDKPQKSLEAYDFAIAIDPNFSSAMVNKANILINSGHLDESISVLDNILYLEENNATALFQRGFVQLQLQNYKNAYSDLKNSLKIEENNSEAWYNLSKLYLKFNKISRAKKALYNSLFIENLNSKYWAFAAKIFLTEDNYELADKAYMHAISFDPFEDKYWFDFSDYKRKIKDISEAISILKSGKEFITDVCLLNLKLSSLHLLNKDNTNAIITYKEASKLNPKALYKLNKIHPNKNEVEFLEENV